MKGSARFLKPLLFLAIILVALFLSPKNAFATLSNCSVTLDTPRVEINVATGVIFEITNNDDNYGRMLWVGVTVPLGSDFSIQNNGQSQSFSGFDVGVGNPIDESIAVVPGGNTAPSQSWIVQASDDANGANPTTCAGDTGIETIDPANYNPPQISSATVSNVTDTTATLSFTTNRDATVELDYGISNYSNVKTESGPTSSHVFNLDTMTANSTYNFVIKATNSNGETDARGSFTTAATPYATAAPQVINTTTVTTTVQTVTPTPTPTPIPDTTPPLIYITTDFSKPFAGSPQISGRATDNKQVAKMDYSLDGGHNWLPVDSVASAGKPATSFDFLPAPLDDGNYALVVRGIDSSGNIGTSKVYTLVIDRLPPQASGVLFSLGPQIVNPRSDGSVVALAGQQLRITLSDVGGSTGAAILAIDLSGKNSTKTFNLTKNSDSGLWSGTFSLKMGNYQLVFSAIDGASNKTVRNLNKVIVVANGQVNGLVGGTVPNAKIVVYYQEPVTDTWQVWDASAYSQNNPQTTDENGNYNLFLPSGKYYLHIEAFGFKVSDTQFFTIDSPQPVNANFSLSPLKLIFSLGFIKIYLPDFSVLSLPFKNNLSNLTEGSNDMLGKSTPFFNLSVSGQNPFTSDSLTGKPTVLTFLNTWSPESTEQISILDKFAKNKDFNSAVIVEGEKVSKVYVFQKRGEYSLPIFADPDATLAMPYNLSSLPVHYFLDKKGVVQKVIYGALSEEELANTLVNISQ